MSASAHVSPVPIRVHSGVQRRGRKLADWKQSLVNQAVREVQERERLGLTVSVRAVAERYHIPKSTLHRYLRSANADSKPRPRSQKHGIDYILSNQEVSPIKMKH